MNYIETIKCEDYEVYNLEYHEKRVANTIGKNFYLRDYIYPNSNELLKCKITYNENEILDVSFSPYKKKQIHTLKLVFDDTIEYKYKYENRDKLNKLLNDAKVKEKVVDDIVIVKNGFITDTTIANIAILLENENGLNQKWYTPKTPLLPGTARARNLELNKIKETNITVQMLQRAKKIALLNAMIDFDVLEDYEILV